jgi:uncharacterized protein with HEPN domain
MHPSQIDFLKHIQEELGFILEHSTDLSYDEFVNHPLLPKAVIRSFEIIGEACKNVSDEVKYTHAEFDWKGFAGMRDKLIHHYWGIDYQLLWDAILHEVSINKEWINVIIEQELAKLPDN